MLLAWGETGAHEMEQGKVDIGRLQRDFVLVSLKHKSISILELTLPLIAQLEEAYSKKKVRYAPVLSALQHYIQEGWNIYIL